MDKYRHLERREFKIRSIILKFKKLLDSFPHENPSTLNSLTIVFHHLTTQFPRKTGTFFPKNHKIDVSGLHFAGRVKKKEKIYLMNAETTSMFPLTASAPTTLG